MEAVERLDCKDNKTGAQSNERTLSSNDAYEVGYAVLEFPELAKTGFLRSRLISDEPVVLHIEVRTLTFTEIYAVIHVVYNVELCFTK